MTTPIFVNIIPPSGPTRGRRLVAIYGGRFQLPPTPPDTGKTTPPNPSMQVLFGTEPAERVDVMSDGLLHVLTPAHDPGLVSITIQNIDQAGSVIDQLVQPNVYTFVLPNLGPAVENASVLATVVRTLLQALKRQVIPNVELTTNVDYDDSPGDTANIAALATVPGLVLAGPTLRQNRLHSMNAPGTILDSTSGDQTASRPAYTVDLVFTVIGVDDHTMRHLNLLQETINFFHQNTKLKVKNPANPSNVESYEMAIETTPSIVGGANNSNLRAFSGTVAVIGVPLVDDNMAVRAVYPLVDVFPTGSVESTPNTVILTGQPGTFPVAPAAPNPPAEVGKRFSIQQFLADNEE